MVMLQLGLLLGGIAFAGVSWASWAAGYGLDMALSRGAVAFMAASLVAYGGAMVVATAPPAAPPAAVPEPVAAPLAPAAPGSPAAADGGNDAAARPGRPGRPPRPGRETGVAAGPPAEESVLPEQSVLPERRAA